MSCGLYFVFAQTLRVNVAMGAVRVNQERLAEAMSAWFTQRGKGQGQPVRIEIPPA